MAEAPAINASPLIFLARSGQLDLLQLLHPRILVPEPVATEIQARGAGDPTFRALEGTPWLVTMPAVEIAPEILAWDLGRGESSVLAYALARPGTLTILDDRSARRCAQLMDIPHIGTLGLVLRARRQGRIAKARPILIKMKEDGMYLSDAVLNSALELVGE